MDKLINQISEYVKSCSKENEPGHDFSHVQRVVKLAKKIANTVECDIRLVEMIALLHDVEDHKLNADHSVSDFLNSVDIDESYKTKILHILPYLSFSKYKILDLAFPIEGKIVSDADRLDAIGAIGIARAFSYGGSHHRSLLDTIKHFEEKLLVLDQYLYLDISKEIAKKRMEFLKSYYQELLEEMEI